MHRNSHMSCPQATYRLPLPLSPCGVACLVLHQTQADAHQVSEKMSLNLRPPKTRDRIRALFGRSTSPSPNYLTVTPPRTPSPGPVYTADGSNILADALDALTINDRETIKHLLLPTNAISIDTAFNEVHICTTDLQQRCTMKRWS
jgi:hypothetical protein